MAQRSFIRALFSLAAIAVLVVSAPIHAGHGHEASSPSATMHASCAICQSPAPAGTAPGVDCIILDPACCGPVETAPPAAPCDDPRDDTSASRAPPFLLAR